MSRHDIATVKAIAKRIDSFNKPEPGNSVIARKLNAEGLSAFKQDNFTQAAAFFQQARLEDPSDAEIAANLGHARIKEGDFERARQSLLAALLLSPRRVSTWLPIAELAARHDQNTDDSVSALLVAYEWSVKDKAIDFYKTQATGEPYPRFREAYRKALEIALQMRIKSIAGMETGLINALRYDMRSSTRVGNSGDAIQVYMGEGYVSMGPNKRANYTDYYVVTRPTKFMGHDLVLIEEEYLVPPVVGCCVNPGAGVTVRVNGSTNTLQEFATYNRCSFTPHVNLLQKQRAVGIQSGVSPGEYASLSCRERELSQNNISSQRGTVSSKN
jgi:tetratricopeptide (TPR) repeat protein